MAAYGLYAEILRYLSHDTWVRRLRGYEGCDGQKAKQSCAGGTADNPTGSSPGAPRFVYCDDGDLDGVRRDDWSRGAAMPRRLVLTI